MGWIAADAGGVILPLGISFFTFTQIGYLVDCQQGLVRERGLPNYVLFVTFFPHLIAGPILHHREVMPQFADDATYRLNGAKTDSRLHAVRAWGWSRRSCSPTAIAPYADAGFDHTGQLAFLGAWSTALAYSDAALLRLLPAIPTWRSALGRCSASACRSTSTRPINPPA